MSFTIMGAPRTDSVFAYAACSFVQAPADVQTDPRRARVAHACQAHQVRRGGAAEVVWAGVHVRVQVSVTLPYLPLQKQGFRAS